MENQATNRKSVIKKLGDILFVVFMVIMSLLIVLSVVSKKTGKQVFKYSTLWVLSDSMETTIEERSYILVKVCDASELKVGDIITFKSRAPELNGSYNTHRIYEIVVEGEEFITKGDNISIPDEMHVFAEDVVYKYVCNLKVMTFFGRIYASEFGLILTLSIILLVILCYLIASISTYKKEIELQKKQEFDKKVAEEVARLERENAKKE